MQDAGPRKKPALSNLFTDVYDTVPSNLRKQEEQLRESVTRHPRDYPSDVPLWEIIMDVKIQPLVQKNYWHLPSCRFLCPLIDSKRQPICTVILVLGSAQKCRIFLYWTQIALWGTSIYKARQGWKGYLGFKGTGAHPVTVILCSGCRCILPWSMKSFTNTTGSEGVPC